MSAVTMPYGKTFKLKRALRNVECWNFTTDATFTLPAGTEVQLNHVSDSTSTVVTVMEADKCPGILLRYTPRGKKEPVEQLGYRFIVDNQALGKAIGIKVPKETYDVVGAMMAFEENSLSDDETIKLFQYLVDNDMIRGLQGFYGRAADALTKRGLIKPRTT